MALLCSCSEQRGRRVSSPPQPTPASVSGPARPVPTSICQQVRSSVRQLPGCPRRVWMPRSSRETVLAPSEFAEFTGEKGVACHGAEGERQGLGTLIYSTKALGGLLGAGDCPRPHRHTRGPEERGPLPSRSLGSSRREASVQSTHSVREPLFMSIDSQKTTNGDSAMKAGTRYHRSDTGRVTKVAEASPSFCRLLPQSSERHEFGEEAG